MRWRAGILFFLFYAQAALSQQVNFVISILPDNHPAGSPVFLAGNFNQWKPADPDFQFKSDSKGQYRLDVNLAPGDYEYKITRGSWDKVECDREGRSVGNRQLRLSEPMTVDLTIQAWQDQVSPKPRLHTASPQVHILDSAFFIPRLNRKRIIRIYLPEGYSGSLKRYPVLYLQDGQNIFDEASSYAGEWGVDECLDSMRKKCIVVAIDHGGDKRISEYCPYDFSLKGTGLSVTGTLQPGEGPAYVAFLAKTLKPYVDRNYRTLANPDHTFIAGSSLGGLISMYAILRYPKVFGGAGVFSPAFWIAPEIFNEIKKKGKKIKSGIYFYAGKQESEEMVPDMMKAYEALHLVSKCRMTTVIREEGKHNEASWRKEFPLFYQWIIEE